MATAEPGGHAARISTPELRPGEAPGRVTGTAGPPSVRSARRIPRLGERTPVAVEKRGPYVVMRTPSIQAKLRECSPLRVCLGGLQSPLGGLRSPARATPEGRLQPAPASKNVLRESGFLAFGRHGSVGETPLTQAL